jgi:hypothetical protein
MNKKDSSNSEFSSKEDSSQSEVYSSSYIYSSSQSNSKSEENKEKSNIKNLSKKTSIKNVTINNNLNINEKKPKEENIDNQYYKVSIAKIKFMIYDFNQEMVINSNKIEKKSQLEIIIEKFKIKNKINISEDLEFQNISFEKFKDSKNKNYHNEKSINKKIITKKISENQNLLSKEKEFEKEISFALSRQDEQKSIKTFYKISLLFIIVILGMSIGEIYFIIYHYKKLKENLSLIILSTNLKYYTNYGIYYIREITLFNIVNKITNGIYIVPDEDPVNYKNNIIEYAKNIFI